MGLSSLPCQILRNRHLPRAPALGPAQSPWDAMYEFVNAEPLSYEARRS